jgi:transposase InsO family protein
MKILKDASVESVRLPKKSPNLNAYCERFVRSIKFECLEQMIFFIEQSLRYTIDQYLEHYHRERNHQGLDSKIIRPQFEKQENTGDIKCRERLGGLLNYYSRQAA